MLRQLRLAASVGVQLGIVPDQWTALKSGADVTLTRDQLRLFGAHPSKPSDATLDTSPNWKLSGENMLTPAP